jgi:predicted AlkP superfamily pyrophosphatase or phosphodiesterase
MTRTRRQHILSALALACLLFFPLSAGTQSQRRTAAPVRPVNGGAPAAKAKLVLAIVIDQFRYDYLERFRNQFGRDGFRRLCDEGAFFINANYDYVPTYTAPGHAAVFTGSVPSENGIVGNAWYDRDAGKIRVMVSDTAARVVNEHGVVGQTGAPSPRILIGTTIGDQIRLSNQMRSKVVAVSLKDRAAVLPGGQRPNGAYWFDGTSGSFVTSDYYSQELPDWVKKFNSNEGPDRYFGKEWERAAPASAYYTAQAYRAPQRSALGEGFPYTLTGGETKPGPRFYGIFELTPFASEMLANLAKAAIEGEHLGDDEFPDLLAVSFSSPDLIGHTYGPDSQEVEDTYIRLDRTIADLLNYVDKRVGLKNCVVALTADHGVAPIPEYIQSLKMDAGRVSGRDIQDAANRALTARFGGEKWVLGFVNDQLYLDQKMIADRKVDPAEVERVAGEAILSVPGIVDYFTRTQILEGRLPSTGIARRVTNGFNRMRSGDVWIITRPFFFVAEGNLPTTHGSPYNYDTHVPVVLFGLGVNKGRYDLDCSPSDIAPTLAALLGVEPPSTRVGHVLPAVAQPGRRLSR